MALSDSVAVSRADLLHLLNGTREQQEEAVERLQAALSVPSERGYVWRPSSGDGRTIFRKWLVGRTYPENSEYVEVVIVGDWAPLPKDGAI